MLDKRMTWLHFGATLVLFLGTGCNYIALTDQQLVKNLMREHCLAITERDWREAASYYDASVQWKSGRQVLKGRAAAKGFLGSLNKLHNMDEFFAIVHESSKKSDTLIEQQVTFQAHIVVSSTELEFTNRFWNARVGWVKRGPGKWLISYIVEVTPRKEGEFSRF